MLERSRARRSGERGTGRRAAERPTSASGHGVDREPPSRASIARLCHTSGEEDEEPRLGQLDIRDRDRGQSLRRISIGELAPLTSTAPVGLGLTASGL